jgi:hypothetical protein
MDASNPADQNNAFESSIPLLSSCGSRAAGRPARILDGNRAQTLGVEAQRFKGKGWARWPVADCEVRIVRGPWSHEPHKHHLAIARSLSLSLMFWQRNMNEFSFARGPRQSDFVWAEGSQMPLNRGNILSGKNTSDRGAGTPGLTTLRARLESM